MRRLLFIASLLLFSTSVFAYDIEVKNSDGITIYYNYINNKSELEVTYKDTYFKSYKGDVVIPESVTYMDKSYKVTCIGIRAFRYCEDLKNLTIPKTVTTIKKEAFHGSNLTSLTIPNSVTTIEEKAFYGCRKLFSISIPNSVTSIGNSAFQSCERLLSLEIPNSVTFIGESAFVGCKSLTSFEIPNSITSIGDNWFFLCKGLVSVTIPNSVTKIKSTAFEACTSLSSITIPSSVRTIEIMAFCGCTSLTSIVFPHGVVKIEEGAFSQCSSLKSVSIPNSVTYIGGNAFDPTDLLTVISEIKEPFDISGYYSSSRAFSQSSFNNATLYVPSGTIEKYKAKEGWKDFLNIKEGLPSSSIDKVVINRVDNSSIYNLNGQRVGNSLEGLPKGIYIRGGKKQVVN